MKRLLIIALGLLFVVQPLWADKSNFGLGVNAGVNYFVGDIGISESLISPNLGIYGMYRFSPRWNFKVQTGFGQFGVNSPGGGLVTSFIPVELSAMYFPFLMEKLQPFVHLGVGGMSFTIENSDRFNDGVVIGGAGLLMPFKSNLSFLLTSDFHYSFGDDFEGVVMGMGDSYFSFQTGVTYHFGKSKPKFKQENETTEEKTIALIENNKTETFDDSYVIPELKSRINVLREQIAEKDTEINQLREESTTKSARIVELETQLEAMQHQQYAAEAIHTQAVLSDASNSIELTGETADDYMAALNAFNAKDYPTAISRLQQLLNDNPNNKMASNFYYWIGESYFSTHDYEAAIQAFKQVQNYQHSWKLDDALLMLGRCYLKIGDADNAYQNFEQLLERFPDSEFAEKAKFYLQ
ncbi:tetratricopeptide repeat protein [candidate division KSB1 bacterium]|nr:tetratricopeptide repeat protein [candidate division KSB1 bacterium]